jgi:hypothetical protein
MALVVKKTKTLLTVQSDHWSFSHAMKSGGCMSVARVRHGSGKNILCSPIVTYVDQNAGKGAGVIRYSDQFDDTPRIRVLTRRKKQIAVRVEGELKSKQRQSIGISYTIDYEYCTTHVKIKRSLICRKKVDGISVVGAGSFTVARTLQDWTATSSYFHMENDTAADWGVKMGRPAAIWGRLENSYYPNYIDRHIPYHLCLFEEGVEGIECFPDSKLHAWEEQFGEPGKQCGHYSIYANGECASVVIEPLNLEATVSLKGKYELASFLSLPCVKRDGTNKSCIWIGGGTVRPRKDKPWATDDEIKQLADEGNQVLVHHHDNPDGLGIRPDSSFFWADGTYPPYDSHNMKELDRVINTVHKCGMKIIPYFSVNELHPKAPYYREKIRSWARNYGGSKKIRHWNTRGGEFGADVCLGSGWMDCLKQNIKTVMDHHDFDGLYFDMLGHTYCNNPGHSSLMHNTIDEQVDIIAYAREIVGDDGIIVTHQSFFPLIAIENMVNAIVIMEEVPGYPSFYGSNVPTLAEFLPFCSFVNVAHKAVCPYVMLPRKRKKAEERKLIARTLVAGMTFYAAQVEQLDQAVDFSHISKSLTGYDLSKYRFYDHKQSDIEINNQNIKSAVYKSRDSLLIIFANTETNSAERFRWKCDKQWAGDSKFTMKQIDYNASSTEVKVSNRSSNPSGAGILGGFEVAVCELTRVK